jgi:hypothetical protein
MMVLINMGRAAMALWVVYSLVLIFAPAWIHHLPNQKSGIIQFLVAYGLGYLMDRSLSVVRRRKAVLTAGVAPDTAPTPAEDSGTI